MQNLPKPPKLYYYLAGLAIFILILTSVGFYFYQKNNKSTITSTPAPTPISQNSLISNVEQPKNLNTSENKPKEQNLTSLINLENQISSASFDADPNTDVIVFEECNIVLKIKKSLINSKINSYSKTNTGVGWST